MMYTFPDLGHSTFPELLLDGVRSKRKSWCDRPSHECQGDLPGSRVRWSSGLCRVQPYLRLLTSVTLFRASKASGRSLLTVQNVRAKLVNQAISPHPRQAGSSGSFAQVATTLSHCRGEALQVMMFAVWYFALRRPFERSHRNSTLRLHRVLLRQVPPLEELAAMKGD